MKKLLAAILILSLSVSSLASCSVTFKTTKNNESSKVSSSKDKNDDDGDDDDDDDVDDDKKSDSKNDKGNDKDKDKDKDTSKELDFEAMSESELLDYVKDVVKSMKNYSATLTMDMDIEMNLVEIMKASLMESIEAGEIEPDEVDEYLAAIIEMYGASEDDPYMSAGTKIKVDTECTKDWVHSVTKGSSSDESPASVSDSEVYFDLKNGYKYTFDADTKDWVKETTKESGDISNLAKMISNLDASVKKNKLTINCELSAEDFMDNAIGLDNEDEADIRKIKLDAVLVIDTSKDEIVSFDIDVTELLDAMMSASANYSMGPGSDDMVKVNETIYSMEFYDINKTSIDIPDFD